MIIAAQIILLLLALSGIMVALVLPYRWSLYFFIVASVVFPAGGVEYLSLGGITLHEILLPLLGVGLAVALVRSGGILPVAPIERLIVVLMASGFIVQYASLALSYSLGYGDLVALDAEVPVTTVVNTTVARLLIVEGLNAITRILFVAALGRFLLTLDDLRGALKLVYTVAVVLVLEFVFFTTLGRFTPLAEFAYHEFGGYTSMMLNDYVGISMWAMAAVVGAYGAYTQGWKWRHLILGVVALFMVGAGLQRTPVVAALLGLMVLNWGIRPIARLPRQLSWAGLTILVVLVGTLFSFNLRDTLEAVYSGTRRQAEAASLESVFTRVGLQLRAVEVILDKAPMGVGPRMLQYYIGSPTVPSIFGETALVNAEAMIELQRARRGEKVTVAHNAYLETIGEYGLWVVPLMIVVLVCGLRILRNFRRWRQQMLRIPATQVERDAFTLAALALAGSLFFFFCYVGEATPNYFVLYWTYLHALLLLAYHRVERPRSPRRAPAKVMVAP